MLLRMSTIFFLLSFATSIYPHGSENHDKQDTQRKKSSKSEIPIDRKAQSHISEEARNSWLVKINEDYQKKVKNIFKRSCYDCHTDKTKYPWYFKLPGIKQVIERDIKKAKEHLFITETFPFRTHSTPLNDLSAIWKSIDSREMPPLRYRIMHPKSELRPEEKATVKTWIDEANTRLKCDLPC